MTSEIFEILCYRRILNEDAECFLNPIKEMGVVVFELEYVQAVRAHYLEPKVQSFGTETKIWNRF